MTATTVGVGVGSTAFLALVVVVARLAQRVARLEGIAEERARKSSE
jgi:hypothetical protein